MLLDRKQRLDSLCPIKFNPWVCYYLMLVLDCDTPILESLVVGWPLLLDLGEDEANRHEGMRLLFEWLRDLSMEMHKETTDMERDSGEDDLVHYFVMFTDTRRCKVQRLLGQNQPNVLISIQLQDENGLRDSWTLGITGDEVGPPQGLVREQNPHHLSLYFVKRKRIETENYSYDVVFNEPLRFFTYVHQIQQCLIKFVESAREYFRDKGPLPTILNI